MKKLNFVILLCFCQSFSKAAENDTVDYSVLEKHNVYLYLENSELRVNISNVALQFAKLQKEHFETRQKLNKVASHYASLNSNCSILTDQIATLVDSLQTVTENIKPHQSNPYQSDLPKNCANASEGKSGIYTIAIPYSNMEPFEVVCDSDIHDGNWLVIQRRMDGSVDFHRPWLEYKNGFGSLEGEFFIGLDKLYALTAYVPHELLIIMEDFENEKRYAKYDYFKIGSESEMFYLEELGKHDGNAYDSLVESFRNHFTTYDRKSTQLSTNCAQRLLGGWWYADCAGRNNLNGRYLNGRYFADYQYGINWYNFNPEFYSLKFVQIMIQPKKFYRF